MHRPIRSLVVVFVFLVASRAEAQQVDFWTQCVTAPFRACATLQIEAIYHPPEELFLGNAVGISELRFTVSNLTGLPGYQDGAHGLRGVRISGLNYVSGIGVDFFAQALTASGSATIGGAVDWPNLSYAGGFASASFNLDYDSYLYGCNVPAGASTFAGYDQTCGGTITYGAYFVNDQLTLSGNANANLQWAGWSDDGTFNGTANCTTGADCASVTPEPVTMTLLGTGLAGLAAMRGLRRRRKSAEPV